MATIVIDAGHGGADPGAVFEGRQEKDDTLRLALAVGKILEENGQNVIYTRINRCLSDTISESNDRKRSKSRFFCFHTSQFQSGCRAVFRCGNTGL